MGILNSSSIATGETYESAIKRRCRGKYGKLISRVPLVASRLRCFSRSWRKCHGRTSAMGQTKIECSPGAFVTASFRKSETQNQASALMSERIKDFDKAEPVKVCIAG